MRTARLVALAGINVRANARGFALSAAGIAFGIGSLFFFLGLGNGVGTVVREKVFPADALTIEVVPPQVALGSLFGGGQLDEVALGRLRTLPGVADVFAKLPLRVPALSAYNGNFFGKHLEVFFDIIAVGVDARLLSADARQPFSDWGPDAAIPVLVNRRLLEIYNRSFAPSRGLPKLTDSMLVGFQFPCAFGKSFVGGAQSSSPIDTRLQIVGLSERALLGGVTMPLESVRRINRALGQDASTYGAVVLRATTPDRVPALVAAVRGMGYGIDESERRLSQQVGAAIAVVTLTLGLLSVLITMLAAVNIAHAMYASVRERRREIGILRSVGATRGDVRNLLLAEAALLGALGGTVGLLIGRGAAWAADRGAAHYLPDFPFKPETFFSFEPTYFALALGLALVAALGGAFLPARAAASLDPSIALAG